MPDQESSYDRAFTPHNGGRHIKHSSGGKPTLLGISKRGDVYLRTLLVHGARAVVRVVERRTDPPNAWVKRLLARRHPNVAAIALSAKNARTVWALLAHARDYRSDTVPQAPSGAH